MKIQVRDIAYNAIVAALYVILTLITYNFSYGPIQFRVAEILIILCFFRKDYIIGITLGTFISNLFSSVSIFDTLFGTIATIIACIGMMFSRHLIIGIAFPVISNTFIIAWELVLFVPSPASYWYYAATVCAGELTVLLVGYFIALPLMRSERFKELIRANQNIESKL